MMSTNSPYGREKTRRRILQTAWEILDERGAGLRLVDVAERAGVSRQAIYLHFGDRPGLLVALVEYIDTTLGAEENISYVQASPTGQVALARLTKVLAAFTEKIDPVARILETGRDHDQALAVAWNDRMKGRQQVIHDIVERIAQEGVLAQDWTVDTATDLVHALTSPRTWHLFIHELGWSPDQYASDVSTLLKRALTVVDR